VGHRRPVEQPAPVLHPPQSNPLSLPIGEDILVAFEGIGQHIGIDALGAEDGFQLHRQQAGVAVVAGDVAEVQTRDRFFDVSAAIMGRAN